MKISSYLPVEWPDKNGDRPENVFAVTTLINGGVSRGGYSEYNLASHVGDDPEAVKINRAKLVADLQLPSEPVWLEQEHSNIVISADDYAADVHRASVIKADASVTTKKGVVCAVLTADCLPVFFCNDGGTAVAAAHAGWRGLHAGIISNTVRAMASPVDQLQASLGPAIGPHAFEVGDEVYRAFVEKNVRNKSAFTVTKKNHYLCDIYQLARIELRSIGIDRVSGGDYCTYTEDQRFYSYRRQKTTGRMASLIWQK
jgi:polyphenol oxidase